MVWEEDKVKFKVRCLGDELARARRAIITVSTAEQEAVVRHSLLWPRPRALPEG